ncbi:HD domain-containing protein (plasmid) [Deinococcus sp. KNUC1210]|uniref:HD domain-containing phosphohydrolase n=1 Tax=Deinococcus sp. KNUC1210 TaxID=2917691 RepID=UPI001EF03F55|nr:HD domain-containing phosphohydrolase [Deinococcus sp. KNUC1210]ULH17022.1 HD domain-containing protein [Deinococcus sp. KNUC1210]
MTANDSRLFRQQDTYRRLLEAMPVMLWTADAAGNWTHVNAAWIDYTGLIGETRGFGFEAALHPDDEGRTVAAWRQAVEQGHPYHIEYRLRRRDQVYRWFLIRGTPVFDEDGQGIAWVGTCTDIEDQKQAEQHAREAREAALRALGLVLETRDHDTKGHTDRVTQMAVRLGQAMGLEAEQLEALRLGAYLHDIGKLAIPDAILLKPGPLSQQEVDVMRGHLEEGERFAASLGFLPPAVLCVIRSHHERWDGSGYAQGLSGQDIPLLARIFSVVDVYDALVSQRPYKPAWPHEQVIATLKAEAGKHFDPQIVATFLRLYA